MDINVKVHDLHCLIENDVYQVTFSTLENENGLIRKSYFQIKQ